MYWYEMTCYFFSTDKKMKIGLSIILTSLTFTIFLNRLENISNFFILQFKKSSICKCWTKSCSSGWKYTIKHIYSKTWTNDYINRITNSHQITWFIFRQFFSALGNSSPKIILKYNSFLITLSSPPAKPPMAYPLASLCIKSLRDYSLSSGSTPP